MSEAKEPLLFEPDRLPRQRHKASQRRITFKCCLKTLAALSAVVGVMVLILLGKVLSKLVPNMVAAHPDLKQHTGDEHSLMPVVKPLINTTDRFDILATVWLDVTYHLENGGSLPEEVQVARYKQHNGMQRAEAILYSDLIFKNASSKSYLHSSARIRVPVEPLFSQPLGPSTLRGTFKLLPRSFPSDRTFNMSDSIYPKYLPIGPRSPDAPMLKREADMPESNSTALPASSLEEALEYSAINTNLLALLGTKWRLNDTEPNIRDDFGVDPPMFDGSPSNRAFASPHANASHYYYTREDHRIMLAHVCTRSRVMLIKEERQVPLMDYSLRLLNSRSNLAGSCWRLASPKTNMTSDGKCQRPAKDSLFENFLTFRNDEKELPQLYYAPFLAQQATSCAYRHHRTLPRHRPTGSAGNGSATTKKGQDGCLVPILRTEESHEYFEFDWDVAFSSHVYARSAVAESV